MLNLFENNSLEGIFTLKMQSDIELTIDDRFRPIITVEALKPTPAKIRLDFTNPETKQQWDTFINRLVLDSSILPADRETVKKDYFDKVFNSYADEFRANKIKIASFKNIKKDSPKITKDKEQQYYLAVTGEVKEFFTINHPELIQNKSFIKRLSASKITLPGFEKYHFFIDKDLDYKNGQSPFFKGDKYIIAEAATGGIVGNGTTQKAVIENAIEKLTENKDILDEKLANYIIQNGRSPAVPLTDENIQQRAEKIAKSLEKITLSGVDVDNVNDDNIKKIIAENPKIFAHFDDLLRSSLKYFKAETDDFTNYKSIYESKDIALAWESFKNKLNKIISKVNSNNKHAYTPFYWEGKNYKNTGNLPIKEIAKLIKKEIEIYYPEMKVSVTTDTYTGGQSLNVRIKDIGFNPYNEEFIEYMQKHENEHFDFQNYMYEKNNKIRLNYTTLNAQAEDTLKKIEKITNQYNYDDSDAMTDYFDRNYYDHVYLEEDHIIRYFPESKRAKQLLQWREEEKERASKAKEVADIRKGKYKKGEVMFYTGKLHSSWDKYKLPNGYWLVKIIKSPNGRSRIHDSYSFQVLQKLETLTAEWAERYKQDNYKKYIITNQFGQFVTVGQSLTTNEAKLKPLTETEPENENKYLKQANEIAEKLKNLKF